MLARLDNRVINNIAGIPTINKVNPTDISIFFI